MTTELLPIPSETPLHGKDPTNGWFLPGNTLARGNAAARKVARFRALLFKSITPNDFQQVAARLLDAAKAGEPWAQKLFLAYVLGEPRDLDLEQRLADMEAAVQRRSNVFVAVEQLSH